MARQKSYDRQEAVARARDAFRENGFQTLGIRAIEDIVGIGRFAIRTEFGGKEGLFIEAMKLYGQDIHQAVIQPIEQADNLDVLSNLMSAGLDPESDVNGKFGCLFLNTTVENAALQNNDIRELTDAYFSDLLNAVTGLVDRAKAKGTVRSDVDSTGAAEFVKGVFMAAAIISRDAGDVTASTGLINMALYTIDSWRPSQIDP
ncbi:TetR/AcrR family transcriptional regulator [Granulosicoccus antarcticus]|uniref:Tetracyclin repressor-like C-terminal domain-containing protein n=1 Tax=Granulosicoccus antarcticus IMCC3135 TaxID=1192854 RepID=A0A2Z2NUS7_9GAMM|nr:TetR family transcriptional regulator [Granulosicoccus antarcticus]ASJ73478.1 hypothetical protein IMCC3135_16980 [Granulosicoccus antarcticus IMCC3135]